MASVSSKGASSSDILTVSKERIKTLLNVANSLVQKGVMLTAWFQWEVS